MEVTKAPSKELLTFCRQIRPWIQGDEKVSGGIRYIFKPNTPTEVIEELKEIKDKLDWEVLN